MARQWRIEFKGALYHILSRGNEQRDIFFEDDDRKCFLDLLGEISERFSVDIFAYVFMHNHYHLLLRTQKPNLSKCMQWLGTTYTRRFNINHLRSGHLFQGRYKSIIVENEAYLVRLSCYIHRNPLRANIVQRLADYPWSSYPVYAYEKKHPDWLKTDVILNQFNVKDKRRAYRQKVQKYSDEKNRIWENVRHGLIFGSNNFVDKIKSTYLSDRSLDELPQVRSMLKDTDPEIALHEAAAVLGCSVENFRQSRRISEADRDNRDLLIYCLWNTGIFTNLEIGNLFGLTYSSISRRVDIVKEKIKKKRHLKKQIYQLKSLIKV
jgi:REP element-mobilizing transposase RayT